ncbi:MAG: SDR family oxidoreductase [Novosphingobium sp.]|nr:SDR family oxidoreductase [Novosphingobium sp.]
MDFRLGGKRALVTGSSSGIGAAIARELAGEGVSVVIHGRDRERAEAVAADIAARGVKSAVVLGEVTGDADADAIADGALAALGGIDILVNSAGGVVTSGNPDWTDVSSEDWLESFNLNVVSTIRLAKKLTPGMIERGWGRIINISSVGGKMLSGRLHEYGSAKGAVDHVTSNLSRTLGPHGITVNAIAPGTVLTPMAERWIETVKQQNGWDCDFDEAERRYTTEWVEQPVPRLGRVEEIAAAAAFLASPRSDFTTGAIMRVDGGVLRAM